MEQQDIQLVCASLAAVWFTLAVRPGESTSFDCVPAHEEGASSGLACSRCMLASSKYVGTVYAGVLPTSK